MANNYNDYARESSLNKDNRVNDIGVQKLHDKLK
jgi:hypothetical protein